MINHITKQYTDKTTTRELLGAQISTNINQSNESFKLQHSLNTKGQELKNNHVFNIRVVDTILKAFFKLFYILISKPVYSISPNGVKISLLYFKKEVSTPTLRMSKNKRYNEIQRIKLEKLANNQNIYWNKFKMTLLENMDMGLALMNNSDLPLNNSLKQPSTLPTTNTLDLGFRSKLPYLITLISKVLGTNVQLEIVRLKYVYHDSTILSQFLGLNSQNWTFGKLKKIVARKIWVQSSKQRSIILRQRVLDQLQGKDKTLINNKDIVTKLTGFKIRISGRLAKQRIVPKNTVKVTYKGAISARKNNLVDTSTFTSKNKKGAFSIRVWLSHGY